MIVVDASAMAVALADDGPDGAASRTALAGEAVTAPELIDLEVLSVLLRRCWELRDTVTAYDAAYIALAEALGVALLTADARLSRAPGIRCHVELLS